MTYFPISYFSGGDPRGSDPERQLNDARAALPPDVVPDRKTALAMLNEMGFQYHPHRIKAFQRRANLPVTGVVDRDTYALISADHQLFAPFFRSTQEAKTTVAENFATGGHIATGFQRAAYTNLFRERYGREPTSDELDIAESAAAQVPGTVIDQSTFNPVEIIPEVVGLMHHEGRDRAYQRYRNIVHEPVAKRTHELRDVWPSLPPELATVFAQQGLDPDSDIVVQAALLGLKDSAPDEDGDTKRLIRQQRRFLARALATGREIDLTKSPVWEDMLERTGESPAPGTQNVEQPSKGAGGPLGIAQDIVRTGLAAIQAPYEEGQGVFRNTVSSIINLPATPALVRAGFSDSSDFVNRYREALAQDPVAQGALGLAKEAGIYGTPVVDTQSAFGIMLENAITGKGSTNMGQGWLPSFESPVYQEQAERARTALSIAGHAGTPGRLYAYAVGLDPHSQAYNILSGLTDFAVAFKLDPANLILAGLSGRRLLTKRFAPTIVKNGIEETGLINAARRAWIPMTFEQWTQSPHGRKVIETLANMNGSKDFLRIRKIVNGDAETAVKLFDAKTPDEVADVLRGVAGRSLRDIPTLPKFRTPLEFSRIAAMLPGPAYDIKDINQSVETGVRAMLNARVNPDLMSGLSYNLSLAHTPEQIEKGVVAIQNAIYDSLIEHGDVATHAKKLTTMFLDSSHDTVRYMLDEVGENMSPPWVIWDGVGEPLPTPIRYIEFLQRAIPTGDVREIKRMTSFLGPIYRSRLLGAGVGAGAGLTLGVSKAVIEGDDLEGTIRSAIAGAGAGALFGATPRETTMVLDTFMTNIFKPLALITRLAWPIRVVGEEQVRMAAAGYDSTFSSPLSYISWVVARKGGLTEADFMKAAKAQDFDTAFGKALSRHSSSGPQHILDDPAGGIRVKWRQRFRKNRDLEYTRAYAEELAKNNEDPIMRYLAEHGADQTKEWFWSSERGYELRDELAQGGFGWNNLYRRHWSDAYIDTLQRQLDIVTDGQDDLLRVIASGKFGDDELDLFRTGRRGKRVNDKFRDYVQAKVDLDHGPEFVPGDRMIHTGAARNFKEMADKATKYLFDHLMGIPTDTLSRSVVFRQEYWNRVIELAHLLPPDELQRVIQAAERVGISGPVESRFSRGLIGELKKVRSIGTASDLTLEHVDMLAKARGLEVTRELLYDLSERSQVFDSLRLIFPFGEAWKEVITRWAGIVKQHPQVIRRGQQGIQGARGAGWFYENDYGDEVFAYPFTGQLSNKMVGVPIPLEGKVNGLNLVGNVWPGVGPVVQIPSVFFLPETPDFRFMEEVVFPFGRPESNDPVGLAVDSVIPAFFDKFRAYWESPDFQKQYNNAVMEIDRMLSTSGDYGWGQDELNRRLKDAKAMARRFMLFRGFAQNVLPSAPVPHWDLYDKDGVLRSVALLADKLRKLEEEDYETAAEKFINEYGLNAYGALTPLSRATTYQLPVTKTGLQWQQTHGDIVEDYPAAFGFIAPYRPDEELDPIAFQQQYNDDRRFSYEPEIWQRVANDAMGRYLYDDARRNMGPEEEWRDEDRDRLAAYRQRLRKDLPGYESDLGKIGRASTEDLIDEFERMAKDPRLEDNRTVQGIAAYLDYRHDLQKVATERYDSPRADWTRRKDAADLRRQADKRQKELMAWEPALGPVFSIVFRNDIVNLDVA